MQIEEKKNHLTDRERWKTFVKRMDEGLRTAKRKDDKFCKKVEGFLTALNGKTPETNKHGYVVCYNKRNKQTGLMYVLLSCDRFSIANAMIFKNV